MLIFVKTIIRKEYGFPEKNYVYSDELLDLFNTYIEIKKEYEKSNKGIKQRVML